MPHRPTRRHISNVYYGPKTSTAHVTGTVSGLYWVGLRVGPGAGGFTSLDPESRRVVPEANGRPVIKLVYTVLESQYQSSLTEAVQRINATNDKVCYEIIGYLLEELRDEKNFENFQADLQSANIFVGSLIFIEDLAEKVWPSRQLPGVRPHHECAHDGPPDT